MRIRNTHKRFSTDLIREMVRFCKPFGISNFDVVIKNSRPGRYAGRAYWAGSSYHRGRACPFVLVRLGQFKCPRIKEDRRGAYLPYTVFSEEEMLLKILAHELRHLWQSKHPRGYRVWGAKGRFSERDADAYAIHKVREWRRR